jgi:exopolysaccharide production protein ExoY
MRARERSAAVRLPPAFDADMDLSRGRPAPARPSEARLERIGAAQMPLPIRPEAPRAMWPALRPCAKRAMDIGGSLALLLMTAPIFLTLYLLARFEGGPAFYVHRRIGRDGIPFGCLKFRTMVPDADRVLEALLARDPAARREWQATWKLKSDPRVTCRGAFLRATSLDELPQLFNVLRGEMSLVGPRPVVQAELDTLYGPAAPVYMSVRPGLTGPWQVSGRSDADYDGRVSLDVAYVRNPSIRTDLMILLRTVGAVLKRRGAY